jgi:hypothetical protein
MRMDADFSRNRRYRYCLTREWNANSHPLVFIGLNPSTADEKNDDPTIRRCVGFARAWGYGGIVMLNLFAYRATDPYDMILTPDPIGPRNNQELLNWTDREFVVAAWGTHGAFKNRDIDVWNLLQPRRIYTLGLTKNGHPKHPLYLPSTAVPILWSGPNDHR